MTLKEQPWWTKGAVSPSPAGNCAGKGDQGQGGRTRGGTSQSEPCYRVQQQDDENSSFCIDPQFSCTGDSYLEERLHC